VLVTAYPLHRPDGKWSILLVNKDAEQAHAVRVVFHDDAAKKDLAFAGEVELASFGPDNYVWHPDGANGYAKPDGPLAPGKPPGGANARYTLPRASVIVLTGKVEPAR